jgi:hypothetical protein
MALLSTYFLIVTLSSCAASTEDRVRAHFNISASSPVTEATIKEAVLRLLPVGTPASTIKGTLSQVGIGKDGLSRYFEPNKENVAVIFINYDVHTFGVVKASYSISLRLSSEQTIQDVDVKTVITAL